MTEQDSALTRISKLLSEVGLADVLKNIAAGVTALSGLIAAVTGLVKICKGEADLLFQILLYCGPVLLWLSCLYVYFRKKKPKAQRGFAPAAPQPEVYAFPPLARRAAFHALYLIPVITLIGGLTIYVVTNRPSDKVIISVAMFNDVDKSSAGAFETVIQKLREATKNYESQIKIDPLPTTITEQDGGSDAARQAGASRKSSIVIWGWTRKDNITVYLELLRRNRIRIAQGNEQMLSLEVGTDRSFTVQMRQFSEGVAYFALLAVGLARYEAEDFPAAVRFLNDALEHASKVQSQDPDFNKNLDLARAHFYLGRALADQGSYDQAIVHYNEALKLNSKLAEAYLYLGYSQHFVGDDPGAKESFTKAVAEFTEIIKNDSGNVSAYLNRSGAYTNRGEEGDLANALEDCDNALRLDNDSAPAHNNRGLILFKKRQTDAAIAEFNNAIRLDARNSSAFNNRGTAYSNKGEYAKALADYQKVIDLRPADSSSYLNRAFVHFDNRDYDRAIADYDKAIQLNPGNFRAYRNRGWAHMFLGHYGPAARDAARFLELQSTPNKQFIYVTILGYYAYRKSNNPAAAQALLDHVTADCENLGWPYSLIKFLRQQLDAQQLLQEAGQDQDQLTEAHTYIGMNLSLSAQTADAANHFKWVEEQGNREYDEYHLALAESNRLGATHGR